MHTNHCVTKDRTIVCVGFINIDYSVSLLFKTWRLSVPQNVQGVWKSQPSGWREDGPTDQPAEGGPTACWRRWWKVWWGDGCEIMQYFCLKVVLLKHVVIVRRIYRAWLLFMLTGDSEASQRWGWAGSGWRSSENRRIVSFTLFYRNILRGVYS